MGIFGGGSDRKTRRRLSMLAQQLTGRYGPGNTFGIRDVRAGPLSFGVDESGALAFEGADALFGPTFNTEAFNALQALRAPGFARDEARLVAQGRGGLSGAQAGFFEAKNRAGLMDLLASYDIGFRERQLQAGHLFPALFQGMNLGEGRATQAANLRQAGIAARKGPSALGGLVSTLAPVAAGFFAGPPGASATSALLGGGSLFGAGSFGGQNVFGTGMANDPLRSGVFT